MNVWLIEWCDYDGGFNEAAYASEEAAVRHLKAPYGPPYKVVWTEQRRHNGDLVIRGDFESVPGYSVKHVAVYEIVAVEVET